MPQRILNYTNGNRLLYICLFSWVHEGRKRGKRENTAINIGLLHLLPKFAINLLRYLIEARLLSTIHHLPDYLAPSLVA